MGFICACCFAANESAKCARCDSRSCADCKHDKVLLQVEQEEGAPAPDLDKEEYSEFLHRFEDALLPAYREHFENRLRNRWRTRAEVVRAMIFSQAMLNYRRNVCNEQGVSAADVRYAVALRSFGRLKKDPKGPQVFHLDPQAVSAPEAKPVAIGRGASSRRAAACAFSYLRLLQVPEERARQVGDVLLARGDTPAGSIVRDAFVLDRLRKALDANHDSAEQFLAAATPLLKGEFGFLAEQAEHKDAREAIICEAGLLIQMTQWDEDPDWRAIGRGALARFERVLDEYDDVFPFLVEFYFEDPTHQYKLG